MLTITRISDRLHIPLTDLKDMGNEHKKIAKSIKIQSQDRWEGRVTGAANWHQEEHIQHPLSCTWLISEARKLFLINMKNAYSRSRCGALPFSHPWLASQSATFILLCGDWGKAITPCRGLQKPYWERANKEGRWDRRCWKLQLGLAEESEVRRNSGISVLTGFAVDHMAYLLIITRGLNSSRRGGAFVTTAVQWWVQSLQYDLIHLEGIKQGIHLSIRCEIKTTYNGQW